MAEKLWPGALQLPSSCPPAALQQVRSAYRAEGQSHDVCWGLQTAWDHLS